MQQEIQVNVTLTYSANAELSADQLREAIRADVARLLDPDDTLADIDLVHIALSRVREERDIYDADDTAPDMRAALRLALEALENARLEYDYHGNPMDECDANVIAAVDVLRAVIDNTKAEA